MIKASLFTRGGELVKNFFIPEFQILPEVMVWGNRVFVLRHPFVQKAGEVMEPEYLEACPWSVDASLAMWG